MGLKFFGQFLIEEECITSSQLRQALDLMDETHVKVGELALEMGYLNHLQVDNLHREQRYLDAPIGMLAVKRGYLTEAQLTTLLEEQDKRRLRIGDALVELGFVEATNIENYFGKFQDEQSQFGPAIKPPGPLANSRLAEYLLGFFPRIALRIGGIKLKVAEGNLVADRHMGPYTASVSISGEGGLNLMISVDGEFATELMKGLLGIELAEEDEVPPLNDGLGEFLSIIAGNSLRALQEEGVQGELGPPNYGETAPEGGFAFALVSTIGTGTLILTPEQS